MANINKRNFKHVATWQAKVRRQGYPPLTRTFDRRADAEAWAATVESEIARGVFRDRSEAEHTTLREGLDRYLREVTSAKRSADREAYLVRSLAKTRLADYSFATLRSADVARWRDERLKEVSAGTVRRALLLLSHLFNTARREWGMEGLTNPIEAVSKPRPSRGRERRLLPGEEQELLARVREYGGFIEPVTLLALETAMRRGEIASLRWEHVDLRRRIVHLPITKNGESRDVPLSTRAVGVLQALPRRMDGWVFGIRPDVITQAFERVVGAASGGKQAKKRASITPLLDLRFHDLRHEAISRLFERGLNPMQVASISGHKTLQMLRRYTHLRAEDLVKLLA